MLEEIALLWKVCVCSLGMLLDPVLLLIVQLVAVDRGTFP